MQQARLADALPANGPREHWMRAKLTFEGGTLTARPYRDQDSSLVSVFAVSDALLRRAPNAPPAAAGDVADILPLARA
jgi:molybdopterin molybdotransferase